MLREKPITNQFIRDNVKVKNKPARKAELAEASINLYKKRDMRQS
jgi:hypothetical protein